MKINITPISIAIGLLLVLFRLNSMIAWPWVWVLAPFWIPYCISIFTKVCIHILVSRVKRGESTGIIKVSRRTK